MNSAGGSGGEGFAGSVAPLVYPLYPPNLSEIRVYTSQTHFVLKRALPLTPNRLIFTRTYDRYSVWSVSLLLPSSDILDYIFNKAMRSLSAHCIRVPEGKRRSRQQEPALYSLQ